MAEYGHQAHARNVRAGVPAISATVDVTSGLADGGSPGVEQHSHDRCRHDFRQLAPRLLWRDLLDRKRAAGRRADSGYLMNWVGDSGPVRTYSFPACPSSHRARTATAAISRSSIGAVGTARYGQRTTSPARICGAHQPKAFPANMPGRRNVHSSPEVSMRRSILRSRIAGRIGLLEEGVRRFERRGEEYDAACVPGDALERGNDRSLAGRPKPGRPCRYRPGSGPGSPGERDLRALPQPVTGNEPCPGAASSRRLPRRWPAIGRARGCLRCLSRQ